MFVFHNQKGNRKGWRTKILVYKIADRGRTLCVMDYTSRYDLLAIEFGGCLRLNNTVIKIGTMCHICGQSKIGFKPPML